MSVRAKTVMTPPSSDVGFRISNYFGFLFLTYVMISDYFSPLEYFLSLRFQQYGGESYMNM